MAGERTFCVHCHHPMPGDPVMDPLACSFGCAIAAERIPVGLMVRVDGSKEAWEITGGNRHSLQVRTPRQRRKVRPAQVEEVLGWVPEMSAEELWREHSAREEAPSGQ